MEVKRDRYKRTKRYRITTNEKSVDDNVHALFVQDEGVSVGSGVSVSISVGVDDGVAEGVTVNVGV